MSCFFPLDLDVLVLICAVLPTTLHTHVTWTGASRSVSAAAAAAPQTHSCQRRQRRRHHEASAMPLMTSRPVNELMQNLSMSSGKDKTEESGALCA